MIGVFDSGLGGLSVLAAIANALPQADLLYFADTAHVPYGDKDDAFIRRRVLAIGQHLADQGCVLVVVACNTATAAAVAAFRELIPGLPVVGVEPGVKPAAAASRSGRIAVLATASTARSQRLANLIRQHAATVQVDVEACPGWATRVETLHLDDPGFAEEARQHLAPLLAAGADQIVLGCTHYAFLRPVLEPIVANRAALVDVAEAVARQCVRLAGAAAVGDGRLALLATAQPERLQAALPALGLDWLARRVSGAARLALA
ncbi:MAG: glutamate racemase [Rhodobacteraceae bacterium]|uniref:glutamate racemase n=1 Tax=Accumulibacter sp. TaxID=2053492 RepID=UPI001A046195|nr:glutamate racemase [Accumulibacter sp.]MBE2260771.1 glutamate racemase [Paracoccaceae bacterium]MCB1941813.1 glutamate racemase [Accumulibacter sp.]